MIDWLLLSFKCSFSKDKQYFKILKDVFGLFPNNIELYKLALIHKSASIVLEDGAHINNERLEFLGDAVIEAVVSDMLYIEFPYEDEGFMTQLRSKIVSRVSLNELAIKLGLSEYVISQNNYNSNAKKHIYGDAFEALIGAMYLDKGYNYVNKLLINKIFRDYMSIDNLMVIETDYKSRLIEWSQRNKRPIVFENKHGADFSEHEPQFESVVSISGKQSGYGIGDSKKAAEQRAAKNAIEQLNIEI